MPSNQPHCTLGLQSQLDAIPLHSPPSDMACLLSRHDLCKASYAENSSPSETAGDALAFSGPAWLGRLGIPPPPRRQVEGPNTVANLPGIRLAPGAAEPSEGSRPPTFAFHRNGGGRAIRHGVLSSTPLVPASERCGERQQAHSSPFTRPNDPDHDGMPQQERVAVLGSGGARATN